MANKNKRGSSVKTSETVFGIIESLISLDGAGVTEVAEEVGIAKSTAYDHLQTLTEMEFLIKDDNTYYVGLKFLDYGYYAKTQLHDINSLRPTLQQIAEETGELVWFGVEEHGQAVALEMAAGDQAVRTVDRHGFRSHLHVHATGKAILAALPDERAEAIIDRRGLPAATPQTITDRAVLSAELNEIRDRGYAIATDEAVRGLSSIASAVEPNGNVLGAVTVVGPTHRFGNTRLREDLPDIVLGAANALQLNITYS
jgi:DNA-binding IclR family transcriptional regulator